jgi:hypothetical protein
MNIKRIIQISSARNNFNFTENFLVVFIYSSQCSDDRKITQSATNLQYPYGKSQTATKCRLKKVRRQLTQTAKNPDGKNAKVQYFGCRLRRQKKQLLPSQTAKACRLRRRHIAAPVVTLSVCKPDSWKPSSGRFSLAG